MKNPINEINCHIENKKFRTAVYLHLYTHKKVYKPSCSVVQTRGRDCTPSPALVDAATLTL